MRRYNPKEIEPKWQKVWESNKAFKADDSSNKPKKYLLEYFPYPSGAAMHVGHVRNYTIGDAVSRFTRMRGYNVLHPMGWDAFGLPAENYAIKNLISPKQAIKENTDKFKKQLIQMGFSYDWSREIDSTDPNYYKWTQWFFLLLHKRGLAYQQESLQWWCPVDKTVLANEQVEAGLCWRCGNQVEKKALKQWFFKITDYADRLAADLEDLDWPEGIKLMQRNWIGKSKGAEVDFKIDGLKEKITVFTTRPDTLFGATFMVLAPEHPLIAKIPKSLELENYVSSAIAKTDIERQETEHEKTGVFTGVYAINPVNNEKIPIWVADYVLMGYGTGAIMAVPAHDERDWEFAKKFKLPIKQVIEPVYVQNVDPGKVQPDLPFVERNAIVAIVKHWKDEKYMGLKWKKVDWDTFLTGGIEVGQTAKQAALTEIKEETGYLHLKLIKTLDSTHAKFFHVPKNENRFAHFKAFYFELVDDEQVDVSDVEKQNHNVVWLSQEEMETFRLPESHRYLWDQLLSRGRVHTGEGVMLNSDKYDGLDSSEARDKITAWLAKKGQAKEKINYKIRDWLISRQRYWGAPIPIIHCKKCGAQPVPEKDLPVELPDIKNYEPSGDGRSPLANVSEFVNTTCPKCGGKGERETDTMDGFACSSWYFLRFADPHNNNAAFDKAKAEFWLPVDEYIGGAEHAVMHLLYARFWTKVMYDEELISFQEPFKKLRNQGMILAPDGQKMSKSKNNTIEPDGLIDQGYGADSIRLMELFIGPWDQSVNWSVEGLGGTFRFLQRVWTICQEYLEINSKKSTVDSSDGSKEILSVTHKTIKRVSEDLQELGFNTAISALMEFTNGLYKIKAEKGFTSKQWKFTLETLVQLLAPFSPHIAEELWEQLGNTESVHTSQWPVHDEKYLLSDSMTIVVQVNGKVRANIDVPSDSNEQTIVKVAKADGNVSKHLGREPKKTIYVPNKLINFVV